MNLNLINWLSCVLLHSRFLPAAPKLLLIILFQDIFCIILGPLLLFSFFVFVLGISSPPLRYHFRRLFIFFSEADFLVYSMAWEPIYTFIFVILSFLIFNLKGMLSLRIVLPFYWRLKVMISFIFTIARFQHTLWHLIN